MPRNKGKARKRKRAEQCVLPSDSRQYAAQRRDRERDAAFSGTAMVSYDAADAQRNAAAANESAAALVTSAVLTEQSRRITIAGYFLMALDAPPACDDTETVSWIVSKKGLNMRPGSRNVVRRVLRDVRDCARESKEYTGERAASSRMMMAAIELGSVASEIIAESMEDGAGSRRAHEDVCDWLRRRHESGEEDVPHWGPSATYSCYLRMKPVVTVVLKRAQGSDDEKSVW